MALKVWLPLDGNLENKGISNVSITNVGAVINSTGKIGQSYKFETTGSYMTLPGSTVTDFKACSVTMWVNIISWNQAYATFLQIGRSSQPWNDYIFGILRDNSTSKICFALSNGSSSTQNNYETSDLSINTWYHLGFTYGDGKCAIYINGELYNEYTPSVLPDFTKVTDITIGKSNNKTAYQTNCLMNDLRIYDECLSPKQIKEISKGLVAHYKFEGAGARENLLDESKLSAGTLAQKTTETLFGLPVYKGVYTSGAYLDTYSINSFIAPTGDTYYTGSFWAKGTGGITCYFYPNVVTSGINSQGRTTTSADGNIAFTLTSGWQKYWVTWKTSSSISGNKNLIFGRITSGEAYISNPKLELGQEVSDWIPNINDKLYTDLGYDKMMLKDFSGYGHDLTQVGTQSTLDIDSPRYRANVMNNNNDYFYYNGFNINGDSTFSAWFKIKAWKSSGDASSYIYHLGYGTSTTQHCIWVISNSIKLFANGTQINPSYNFSLNTWYHVVTTISGTTANIYINGVNIKTATCNAPVTCNLLTVMNRSANSTPGSDGGYKANGNISDLRFYATALSDTDVKELYQTSAFIDNRNNMMAYEFVEGV